MKAIETGDDLKQLTEVLDWQFSFENLYGSASYGTGLVVNDIGALILKKYTNLLRDANFLKHFHEKRLERQRIQNNMTALEELRNVSLFDLAVHVYQ